MNIYRLTFSALLIAVGVITSHLIYIPVGVAKCYPVQHTINVLSAVLLGPWYAVFNAFTVSLLRNILGTGSLLAFPGSMIGAFLAAVAYRKTGRLLPAVLGEITGTGILGALAAYPVAKFVLGKSTAALFFVVPFLASTTGGSIIGYFILKCLPLREASQKLATGEKK
ncbi:MAG: energy coupling factor transporter S component ThiW [Peptococcaceae bacterium]|jgi:energy coupling factor transporter S component ThiW|nr:energy coupling factor transporter S component ThiW [Peptococcaceae bacterium]MDH7525219.1 energy coupling factor transporter S component ThiW [Peptococcaceae bacterium]